MLKNLVDWINRDSQSVLCLLGGAGVGKSVFAWLAHHNPQEYDCPAIFFCRHNSERKNNAKNVVSSLAYQLALYSPEYAAYLFEVQWMEAAEEASNPDMIPVTQRGDAFKKLILDGLHHIRVPEGRNLLVIVDALDECEKPGSLGRMNLLLTIKDYHKSLPKGMKLLVTSRPEEDIVIALESIQPDQMLIQQQQAIRDVFFYLEVKFTKMCADAKMFFSLDMRDAAARLADASQGVFVFAALACNQLSEVDTQDRNGFKKEFLEMVATLCEGGGNMDSIYVPFLEMHYKDAGPQDFSMFKSFMGVVTALSIALTGESVALILKVPSYMVDAIVLRVRQTQL
ncbi:hypothetical protein BDR26DRAFT_653344 [Obelidium mucronatum]|nr:hypothetical protein BDR26DRAFT_653344 [Obelidium mucronatum]